MSESIVDVRFSQDGGHNWSNWRTRSLGEVGAFQKRAVLRRMGVGRQWVMEIRVADQCKRDLLVGSMQIEVGE